MTNQSSSTLIYFGMWKGKIVAGIFNIPNRRMQGHAYTSHNGGSATPRRGKFKKIYKKGEVVSQRGVLYFPFPSRSSAGMRAWKGGTSSNAWVITGALCLNCRENPAWRGALEGKGESFLEHCQQQTLLQIHCHPALLDALIHKLIRDRGRSVSLCPRWHPASHSSPTCHPSQA